MHIVVLIKAIPDLSGIYVSKSQQKVIENNPPVIDPVCENALEYALSIKDRTDAFISAVLLVTIKNPLYSDSIYEGLLRSAVAMGADGVYLLDDPVFLDGDEYSTAYALTSCIKKMDKPLDLLVAGAGPTGIMVVESLGLAKENFITIKQGENIPRLPNAVSIIKAAKRSIIRWGATELGVDRDLCGRNGRLTEVIRTYLI